MVASNPRAWVLVTGAANNLNEEERIACVLLGRLLAREGYGLLSGTWGGTDEIVTAAFVESVDPSVRKDRIVHVVNHPHYSSHSIRVGSAIQSSPKDGYSHEAVQKADVGIVVSGRQGSKPTMDALARYGKPVLPLAWLGNDALACLLELLESIGPSNSERSKRRFLLPFIDPSSGHDETLSRALGASTCRAHEIFISYHREDTGPDAGRVAATLVELYGEKRVFIDYLSFRPAQSLEQLVANAGSVRLLLAFIGKKWAAKVVSETDFVRRELLAGMRGGARLVPVFVDGVVPHEVDAPEPLKELLRINGAHLNRLQWNATMRDLEGVIDDALRITRMTP